MKQKPQPIIWLDEAEAGEISALGRLSLAGLPVVPGFLITGQAHQQLLEANRLQKFISKELQALDGLTASPFQIAKTIRERLKKAEWSAPFIESLNQRVTRLRLLSQRQTLILEIHAPTSSREYQASVIIGPQAELGPALKRAILDLYQPHLIEQADWREGLLADQSVRWLVRPLIETELSGRLAIVSPDELRVEAIWGDMEPLRSGLVRGDRLTVQLPEMNVLQSDLSRQAWQIVHLQGKPVHRTVPRSRQTESKLESEQLAQLSQLAYLINSQSSQPLTVWFIIDTHGQIWLTAASPIGEMLTQPTASTPLLPSLRGKSLQAGYAVGRLHHFQKGRPIVSTDEPLVVACEAIRDLPAELPESVRAIVAQHGRPQDPASQWAKQHETPVLIGLTQGWASLVEGLLVTVDGFSGQLSLGKQEHSAQVQPLAHSATATQLYLWQDRFLPSAAAVAASDGVGYLSAQALYQQLGGHPQTWLKADQRKQLINQLAAILHQTLKDLGPKPLFYSLGDGSTADFRQLPGGAAHEAEESHPLLGFRGAHRLLRQPELLHLELEALRLVTAEAQPQQVRLLLPFCRTLEEVEKLCHFIHTAGLRHRADISIWLLLQVPAMIHQLPALVRDELIDGICLDSRTLCQLAFAAADSQPQHQDDYSVHRPAVLDYLIETVERLHQLHLPVTLAHAELLGLPQVVEVLIEAGLSGLVVTEDEIEPMRSLLASVEQRIILDYAVAESGVE